MVSSYSEKVGRGGRSLGCDLVVGGYASGKHRECCNGGLCEWHRRIAGGMGGTNLDTRSKSEVDKSMNKGLISEDRSTEATLLFTIPRSCLSRLHRIYL